MTSPDLAANAGRFSGFADLYDAVRPEPPAVLAELLATYSGRRPATVVDLGSGTGLSTRWAARWADPVIGVEPSDDMRAQAIAQASGTTTFVAGWAHDTGLPAGEADVVTAVQALHWMEPATTFAEVARLLRPGGVFAAIDCDWPPTVGVAAAEQAWATCRTRIRVFETRLAHGLAGDELRAPVADDDPAKLGYSGPDAHRDRTLVAGVRSWSKDGHLARMIESGRFAWCHELAVHGEEEGTAERFVALLRSQGDYQTLRHAGVSDEHLGVTTFEEVCRAALGAEPRRWLFTWRVRLGGH
ncbi:MAG: methyltransferase domain containing protein [Actinomycetia bacterium]|nr:methyltransferase domain containing protein [Actinomycetes bacterium]